MANKKKKKNTCKTKYSAIGSECDIKREEQKRHYNIIGNTITRRVLPKIQSFGAAIQTQNLAMCYFQIE